MHHEDPQLAKYDERVAHYQREHDKLMGWRTNRLNKLRQEAGAAIYDRPTTIHDVESVVWSWASNDPKLKEYNAGLEIVERRLLMYSTLAIHRRLAAACQLPV